MSSMYTVGRVGAGGRIDRRQFLRRALGVGAAATGLALLPGCGDLLQAVAETCPEDASESGDINWVPDVMHPVFWGYQEVSAADGAPTDLRIYFPSIGGSPAQASILKMCVVRWPVVLFLHGQPPPTMTSDGYHRHWSDITHTLARSGYVVVVPNREVGPPRNPEAIAQDAQEVLDWVRGQWSEAQWVDQRLESTAVAGHSFGALQAALVAAAEPRIQALLSFSGPFGQLPDTQAALDAVQAIDTPSFFMWGALLAYEELDPPPGSGLQMWSLIDAPKHAAVYQGQHFDYLPGNVDVDRRGPCPDIGLAAGALASLFVATHVPVALSSTRIPVDLQPPQVQLSDRQRFYHGLHLHGLQAIRDDPQCSINLRWQTDGQAGQRQLGS